MAKLSQKSVKVACSILENRPRSYRLEQQGRKIWIPKSLLYGIFKMGSERAEIDMPEWLAQEKKLKYIENN